MRPTTSIPNQRGYTLMELLIASALLAPLVITLFLTLDAMLGTYAKGELRADMQQSARIAMARMVQELRAAGLDPERVIPLLPVATAIQTAEASRIVFIAADDPNDPKRADKSLKIEYRLDLTADPPVLRRRQWSVWNNKGWSIDSKAQPLANGITALEFTYYGADGTAIPWSELGARLGEIQRVGLAVSARSATGQIRLETYRLLGEVRIRNVGL